jgi:MFS family permease
VSGVGVGIVAGAIWAAVASRKRTSDPADFDISSLSPEAVLRGSWGWLTAGFVGAVASAVAFRLLVRWGQRRVALGAVLLTTWVAPTLMSSAAGSLLFAISLGASTAILGGFVGAMVGMLGGIIGADVQRRVVPNQGIRQSAANIWRFTLIGAVIVGIPYGALNVTVGALTTQTMPSAADWVRVGLGGSVFLGLFGGLVPGSACLQHFTLRILLWRAKSGPLDYARFLDYATDRMLLQRVGGRYRFLHILLRDHLADRRWSGEMPPVGRASTEHVRV